VRRAATLSLTLVAILAAGASRAGAGGFDFRLGAFFPRANSNLFQDDAALYAPESGPLRGVKASDFIGLTGGAEYNHVLVRNVEVGFHVDGYGRTVNTRYLENVRSDGSEILQTLKLETIPIGVTLRIVPTSKRARIAPYLGAGVDAIYWRYEEYGDFIDFFTPDFPIVSDHFRSDGWAFGVHAAGGIRFYLNRDFAIVAEGRYQWAEKDMGGDFSPNEPGLVNRIDLSGVSATIGLHVRF
jgi:opacity protein-like surface antigen